MIKRSVDPGSFPRVELVPTIGHLSFKPTSVFGRIGRGRWSRSTPNSGLPITAKNFRRMCQLPYDGGDFPSAARNRAPILRNRNLRDARLIRTHRGSPR